MSSLALTPVLAWQWVCMGVQAGPVALGVHQRTPSSLSNTRPGPLLKACLLLVSTAPSLTTSGQVANPWPLPPSSP